MSAEHLLDEKWVDIKVTHDAPPATSLAVPAFPMVRYDTGPVVYQEALIGGQYLVANASAAGRPKPREWVWRALAGGATGTRPLRTRQHAFQIEADGQLLVDRWTWEGEQEVAEPGTPGREHVVALRHQQRPLAAQVHTLLDGTAFLTRWLTLTNCGSTPLALSHVYPWSGQLWEPVGRPFNTVDLRAFSAPFTLGRFVDSSPGLEGSFAWLPLPDGTYAYESLHGRSGWGAPFAIVRNEVTGEVVVAHLAWSGNWRIELYNDHEPGRRPVCDARLYARLGLAGPAPLYLLEPGESVQTPAVHIGFLHGDLDRCVQGLHRHLRCSVVPAQPQGREHRVEVNHTGYTRNAQITETQLYEEIDVAADVGVELFILDAGWFGDVSDEWYNAVGDWDHESPLLPAGIKAAFERIHERGMLGGLWVEAERMGASSQLLRNHPDWQMRRRGEAIPNLDLSKPEVADHLEKVIVDLVDRYQLDCFRLDYNVNIGEGGEAEKHGYVENVLWRHYQALYGIFDRVRRRYPQLLLENCSSGGGRTDLGMMSRFHWTQVTDNWSPALTLRIVNGMTLALPPEQCETLLGAISDGVADIDFTLRIGLFGHFCVSGIFPTMAERQLAARERWRHHIDLYKRFVRPMLATSRLYHHTPLQSQSEAGEWVVLECASAEADRAIAGLFRLSEAACCDYRFYPRGLAADKRYRVSFDTVGGTRDLDGGTLMDQGLRVHLAAPLSSELLLFEEIQERC